MECSCIRQTDLPYIELFADFVYDFDRVRDFYPWRPERSNRSCRLRKVYFPDDRRAAIVRALTPLMRGIRRSKSWRGAAWRRSSRASRWAVFRPGVHRLQSTDRDQARAGSGSAGVPAVPVFWLATEDHDLAEVDHAWLFGADYKPVTLRASGPVQQRTRPVGTWCRRTCRWRICARRSRVCRSRTKRRR